MFLNKIPLDIIEVYFYRFNFSNRSISSQQIKNLLSLLTVIIHFTKLLVPLFFIWLKMGLIFNPKTVKLVAVK